MENEHRILRRPKCSPDRDAMHTIRIGFLIFIVLWFLLPALFP